MKFTFLHWGFHAWAVYALVGLSLATSRILADFHLLLGLFYPFLDKIYGRIGDAIDILLFLLLYLVLLL
jgi:choline/glycine/proline betaine transport protein